MRECAWSSDPLLATAEEIEHDIMRARKELQQEELALWQSDTITSQRRYDKAVERLKVLQNKLRIRGYSPSNTGQASQVPKQLLRSFSEVTGRLMRPLQKLIGRCDENEVCSDSDHAMVKEQLFPSDHGEVGVENSAVVLKEPVVLKQPSALADEAEAEAEAGRSRQSDFDSEMSYSGEWDEQEFVITFVDDEDPYSGFVDCSLAGDGHSLIHCSQSSNDASVSADQPHPVCDNVSLPDTGDKDNVLIPATSTRQRSLPIFPEPSLPCLSFLPQIPHPYMLLSKQESCEVDEDNVTQSFLLDTPSFANKTISQCEPVLGGDHLVFRPCLASLNEAERNAADSINHTVSDTKIASWSENDHVELGMITDRVRHWTIQDIKYPQDAQDAQEPAAAPAHEMTLDVVFEGMANADVDSQPVPSQSDMRKNSPVDAAESLDGRSSGLDSSDVGEPEENAFDDMVEEGSSWLWEQVNRMGKQCGASTSFGLIASPRSQ